MARLKPQLCIALGTIGFVLACLVACNSEPAKPVWRHPDPVEVRSGVGTILEVDMVLQTVRLQTSDGPLLAWWGPQSQLMRNGQRIATFDGKPGETMKFHGPRASGEQYLNVADIQGGTKKR